jgi:hypothetical protein
MSVYFNAHAFANYHSPDSILFLVHAIPVGVGVAITTKLVGY